MFLLQSPDEERIRRFLAEQEDAPLSYPEIGRSRGDVAPPGYAPNHAHSVLGRGEETFARAVAALDRWAMYEIGWVHVLWPDSPLVEGQVVGLWVDHFGFHSLNACRIVYTTREPRRVEFGYGTLEGHAQQGEERFTVAWGEDDTVGYEIFSFSRPGAWLTLLGYPLGRALQKRFARQSLLAMQRAVSAPSGV